MRIQISPELITELKKIKAKDKALAERIEKQINLFQQDPRYPSLRTHKLSGGQKESSWSISITKGIRMVYTVLGDETAYFFDLGTHDEVYRQ